MDGTRALRTGDLARLGAGLSALPPAGDDAERIDRIRLLEQLKSAAAAAQARETAAFVESQRADQRAAGVPAAQLGRGIAAQVGLAKRESPFRARRYAGWATILTTELPATFAALQAGQITEWRAMILARETAWLSREHRSRVDAELAPALGALGDRRTEAAAKRLAYRLDPHGYTDRLRNAETERRVSLRPAPECMVRLSALLPLAQGVATHTALARAAATARSAGDLRGRGQVMADTLVERITGQSAAPDVPVEICLVMNDTTLLRAHTPRSERSGTDEPASVLGHGPVPAAFARGLLARAASTTPMWIRRLYRQPGTGRLAAMDTARRTFTPNQRLFLRLAGDDICATPWCDAPIRHADHIRPYELGGRTTIANGQGLCEACNHAKQASGWSARRAGHTAGVITRTPTGHHYLSHADDYLSHTDDYLSHAGDPPGGPPSRSAALCRPTRLSRLQPVTDSPVERRLLDLLAA